jgi:ketosteroid isomerase-like protein
MSALDSLIAAERAFSRTSGEKGIREAFLTWLAPDAVVFRPGPVEGRPVYEKMDPAGPAMLSWEPEVAEVSAAGDLGYTSGPYMIRPARGAEPTAFGHYVSVWKKQPDGSWKVLLDSGVGHARPAAAAPAGRVDTPASEKNAEALSPEELRDEEAAFGRKAAGVAGEAAGRGLRRVLDGLASDDIRVLRPGRMPAVGRSHLKELVPATAGRVAGGARDSRAETRTGLAASGDLAYSYGTAALAKKGSGVETTAFLRIWRKDASGLWKICLDVELPVPAGTPAGG